MPCGKLWNIAANLLPILDKSGNFLAFFLPMWSNLAALSRQAARGGYFVLVKMPRCFKRKSNEQIVKGGGH